MPITSLVATPTSPARIDLTWSCGDDDLSPVRLERSVAFGAWALLLDLPGGTEAHSDIGLTPATIYNYRASFLSYQPTPGSVSNEDEATTPELPPPPPPGALASPLNSAVCVYRPRASGDVANEGTRTEPLRLGPTPGADSEDPPYVSDSVGQYLKFSAGKYGVAGVPVAVLNGDVTFALRYRPEAIWADRLLLSIIDNPGPNALKRFMLHQSSNNKYYARFWGNGPQNPQIAAVSNTYCVTSRTDSVAVAWDGTAMEVRIYVNGILEAAGSVGTGRALAVSSGLLVPYQGATSLTPAGKLLGLAVWDIALPAAKIAELHTNPDWLAGG